jgi:hypothetical protein
MMRLSGRVRRRIARLKTAITRKMIETGHGILRRDRAAMGSEGADPDVCVDALSDMAICVWRDCAEWGVSEDEAANEVI